MARDGNRFRGQDHADDPSWGDRLRGVLRVRGASRAVLLAAVVLVVLSSTGVAVASALGGAASASRRPRVVTAAPRLPRGARAIGAVSSASQVTGAVALKLPDQAGLQRFLAAVTNPRSPLYHHYLSRGQFAQRFAPGPDAVAAVEHQLKADDLSVTHVSSNRLLVSFSGTASRVEAAFGTGLERVRLANGTIGRATTGSVKVPAAVAPHVTAVLGLDQLVHNTTSILRRTKAGTHPTPAAVQPRTSGSGPSACSDAKSTVSAGGLTDQEVATAYGLDPLYSAGDTGSGQTVDIFEEEPYDPTDIAAFDECYFGADHTGNITPITVDGGAGNGPGGGEAALDVENVSALAPGAHIHVFTGPLTNLGGTDVWNAIAVADDANQISTSWGLCETAVQEGAPGQQQVESEIFQQIAAQGQSVFSAAGDAGSDDCAGQAASAVAPNLSADDPASQPYVTGVGGTTMVDATNPPTETVWNNGPFGGGGGGGISETWAMPSWQTANVVDQSTASDRPCSDDPGGTADDYHLAGYPTTLASGTLCRELPDVSAVADPQTGMTIFWSGAWGIIGGTSSAAPIWAAIMAEINGSTYCTSPVGFVSPILYEIGSSSGYANAFNDVTSGNNDNLGVGNGTDYPAGSGYDLATGLGTPRVTDGNGSPGLAQQLCADAATNTGSSAPAVTAIAPSSGPSAGGTVVTITGSNFGGTQGSVYFDSTPAHVVTWSPLGTTITVDAPAYTAPPGTSSGAPGRALITVVPSGSTPSSSPSRKSIFDYTATAATGAPVVDYVSTPYGPNGGANKVDIVGANLTNATLVKFGDVSATIDGTADSGAQEELQVTVPATDQVCAYGSESADGICAVQVTVTNPTGPSTGPVPLPAYTGPIVFNQDGSFAAPASCGCEVVPASDEYDYAPTPHITSVSPSFMDEGGTSTATITGTGFNLLTYEWTNIGDPTQEANQDLQLEGISATSVTVGVLSDPNLTIEPDPWPWTVLSAGQLSNTQEVNYAGIPELDSISKHITSQSNPGSLTITGQGLSDVNMVLFQDQSGSIGPAMSTEISGQSDTQLTVAIPSYFAIPTDVIVCSVSGCSTPNPSIDGLTYAYPGQPTLTSSSPKSGPAAGGTLVTLNGTLDSNLTAVHFGTRAAEVQSEPLASPSGQVTVKAPPGTPNSKVNITISTVGGQLVGKSTSAVTSSATFTYGPPAPTGAFTLPAPKVSKTGTLTFKLHAPQAGRFAGAAVTTVKRSGKRKKISFGKASRATSKAGSVTLVIKPSKAARKALAAGAKLKVRVTVKFAPHSGSAVTHRRTVTVRRRT